jgi:hypothetical protein
MFPSMQPAPISDEGPNPPVLHEPDINEARAGLFKASMSQVGPVADIAKAILASQMAAQSKQTLSASDLASMIGRGNVRPSTLGGAITYGMWGPQITNPGAVGLTPNVHEGPGGVVVVTPRDQPPEKTKASDAGTVQATPQEIVPPNTPKNPTASPVVNTPEGVPKVLPGYNESPEAKNIAATNEEGTKILTEGRQKATEFQKMAPVISQMVDLVDNARLGGPTAAWVTKAQQFAKSIGVSNDDAGHIRDQQTLMKYATPAAYSMAHNLTSRPAVVEVLGSLAASAADPSVDPETAKNVYRGFMVKGLNDLEQHNQAIEKFGALPEFGKTRASVYGLNSTPEQILARALQGSRNMYNFNRDEGGVWKDMAIGKLPNTPTTPQPAQKKTIHWNDLPE